MNNKAMETFINKQVEGAMPLETAYSESLVRDFIENNMAYVYNHGYSDKDLDIARAIWADIQDRTKRETTPQKGDAVFIIGKGGKEYSGARVVENMYHDGNPCVCTQPMAPHVKLLSGKLFLSTSGGYFHSTPEEQFKLIGKKTVPFWTWGRYGAGANKGIYFNATVNHWEVQSDEFY